MSDPLLIVGTGPAGLALSHFHRGPSRIVEAASGIGGLCRSIEWGGGVFDIGGHSFHSPRADVRAFVAGLMRGAWHEQRRDARVSVNGQLIAYPFQDHFAELSDAAIVTECAEGLPRSVPETPAANLEAWIESRFGAGIARHFMLPYNRKLWARDLGGISCEWVGERIVSGDPAGAGRAPLQSSSMVGYPAEGGFGAIFDALAEGCGPVDLDCRIVRIDAMAKTATAKDGTTYRWSKLVSTMPLPRLLRAIDGCPPALVDDADALEHVSLKILLVLLGTSVSDEPQRVYVADPAVPPHKIAFNHTSSPSLRARPVQAITCEIAHSPYKTLASDAELTAVTLDWLVGSRLIRNRADVIGTRIVEVPFGYPVYTHQRPAILARIQAWLEATGIRSIGRFGGWTYVNSDACIAEAMALAERLAP